MHGRRRREGARRRDARRPRRRGDRARRPAREGRGRRRQRPPDRRRPARTTSTAARATTSSRPATASARTWSAAAAPTAARPTSRTRSRPTARASSSRSRPRPSTTSSPRPRPSRRRARASPARSRPAPSSPASPGVAGYAPLDPSRPLPVGTVVDTTNGTLTLTAAATSAGATQTADFTGGKFAVSPDARRDDGHRAPPGRRRLQPLPARHRARRGRPHRRDAAGPQAVGQRQGPLPHARAQQLGDRPRHGLAGRRPLRRHAHPRDARRRRGQEPAHEAHAARARRAVGLRAPPARRR